MVHQHAVYLIMKVAIGKYDHLDYTSKNGITTTQYYYPERENRWAHLSVYCWNDDFIQGEAGIKFPWTTYATFQEFLGILAPWKIPLPLFTRLFLPGCTHLPDKIMSTSVQYELTHQWFGDYITAWSGTDGCAGKFRHLLFNRTRIYYEKTPINGNVAMKWIPSFCSRSKRHWLHRAFRRQDHHVYQKGSAVLDMSVCIGRREQFKIVIRDYLMASYDNVQTNDLEMQMYAFTRGSTCIGFSTNGFYRNGYPEFDVLFCWTISLPPLQTNSKTNRNSAIYLKCRCIFRCIIPMATLTISW